MNTCLLRFRAHYRYSLTLREYSWWTGAKTAATPGGPRRSVRCRRTRCPRVAAAAAGTPAVLEDRRLALVGRLLGSTTRQADGAVADRRTGRVSLPIKGCSALVRSAASDESS